MEQNNKRRAEDAERLPAEKLEWEAPAGAQPVGHVVTWNKGGSGEHKSIEPIGKSGYSLAESLPEGTMIWTTSPVAPAVDAAKLDDLGKLKALAEAATPGPWERGPDLTVLPDCGGGTIARLASTRGKFEYEAANANFIAAANPAAILRIAALVAQQAARIAAMRAAGAKMANTMFNLAQGGVGPEMAPSLKSMQAEWDAAIHDTKEGK